MKVIFLDVDGVLNSTKTSVANGGYPFELNEFEAFDMHNIKLLQRFCDSSGVVIVFSSAWRLSNTASEVSKVWELPVIDVTPNIWGQPRGVEIKQWLEENPKVTHYAILDDTDDMLEEQQGNFVLTDPDDGLKWKDFLRMCSILDESPLQGKARDRNWKTKTKAKADNGESWM